MSGQRDRVGSSEGGGRGAAVGGRAARRSGTARRGGSKRWASAAEVLEDRVLPAVTLLIDYSLDNGFFNDPARRGAIEQVADEIGRRLDDPLAAKPTAAYTVKDPKTGADVTRTFAVPADAVRVFVAGAGLAGGALAKTHLSPAMLRVNSATDYAPFAGSIGFDADGTTVWSFDGTPDVSRAERDFRAVARHQLFQVLGVNRESLSWQANVSDGPFGSFFTGSEVERAAEFSPGVDDSGAYFAVGTKALLQPVYSDIYREPTWIDWAALDDIGWTLAADDTIGTTIAGIAYNGFGGSLDGRIDTPTDVDFYRLQVQDGAFLEISGFPFARLFDEFGNELDSGFDNLQYSFESGTYYLGVSGFGLTEYDPNSLDGRTNDDPFDFGDYFLNWTLDFSDDLPSSIEEGPVATGISPGSGPFVTNQALDWDLDVDMYEIEAEAGQTVTIRTSLQSNDSPAANTYVRLFDEDGNELAASDVGGGGEFAFLQYRFTRSGRYFIGVSTWENRFYFPEPDPGGGIGDLIGEYGLSILLQAVNETPVAPEGVGYESAYPDLIGRMSNGTWIVNENAGGQSGLRGARVFGRWDETADWRDVVTGDFDGNGLIDVAGRKNLTAQWWVGRNVDGAFQDALFADWNEKAGWADIRAADFNGDGITDIAARTSSWGWFVALGNKGGFFTTSRWDGWAATAGWRDVLAADFDGDGKADLAGRTSTGHWWVARSTGTAFVTKIWTAWNEALLWRDVVAADFDGDDKADLAGRTYFGQWRVARSTGTGFVTAPWTTWAEAADWRSVMVADVAGDGRPDIVARTATGNWWAAVSTGVGFTNQYLASWDEAHRWQDVMAGDFAGTGKADLLARTAGGAWVVGESDGTRLRFRHFGSWNEALGWRPVLAATHLHSGLAASGDGLGTALPSLLAPVAYSRPVSAAAGSPVPVAGPASPVAASPAAVSPVAASQAVVSPAVALTPAGRIASASASSPVAVTPVAVTPVAVTPATSGLVIADLTKGDDPIELIDDRRLSEPNGSGAGPLDPFAADAGIPDPFADAGLLDRLLALT